MFTPRTLLAISHAALLAAASSLAPAAVSTINFAGGAFSMDFVPISGGGPADDTGYGAVPHDYRIGKHEVSRAMIDAYNVNSGGPVIDMADMSTFGGNGSNRPATGVSWNEAARFVNWLNTSEGYAPAYKFDPGSILADDNIALWAPGDPGYDPDNLFRNSNAYYFLPSEDEWYRAAYYDPTAGVYRDYATGSDSAPAAVGGGTAAGTAVYDQPFAQGPADITNAGGLSPFGTMGQNGNVWEWTEAVIHAPGDAPGALRVGRGGAWLNNTGSLWRIGVFPDDDEDMIIGLRVASVPEPTAMLLAILGGLSVVMRRRRG